MVMYIAVAILVLAVPFLMKWHFSRATDRLILADQVWGSMEQHARVLLEDRTLPSEVGDFVEYMVRKAGEGALTRRILAMLILRKRGGRESHTMRALEKLSAGQDRQFTRFMIDAVLYDSLRTNISGSILRRIVLYWIVATAKDESVPVNHPQIMPMVGAADKLCSAH